TAHMNIAWEARLAVFLTRVKQTPPQLRLPSMRPAPENGNRDSRRHGLGRGALRTVSRAHPCAGRRDPAGPIDPPAVSTLARTWARHEPRSPPPKGRSRGLLITPAAFSVTATTKRLPHRGSQRRSAAARMGENNALEARLRRRLDACRSRSRTNV